MNDSFRASYIALLAAAGGLLWASLRALWVRLPAPDGLEITQVDTPAPFEVLERIRRKIKGPLIHHVLLDDQFNASINQRPGYGLFGSVVNYLTVGLPLLMALDRQRFIAVLAHEYGHLRGDHGQFAVWICRTRLSSTLLEHHRRYDEGLVTMATQLLLHGYFPRFQARTFALARQNEYEADRVAGRLMDPPVAAAVLTVIATKGAWLRTEFWPQYWRGAAVSAQPVGLFAAMRRMLSLPPDAGFAADALRQSLRQISDVDETPTRYCVTDWKCLRCRRRYPPVRPNPLLQRPGCLPLVQHTAHDGDGSAFERSRLSPPAGAPVGVVGAKRLRYFMQRDGAVLNMVLRIFLRVIA